VTLIDEDELQEGMPRDPFLAPAVTKVRGVMLNRWFDVNSSQSNHIDGEKANV